MINYRKVELFKIASQLSWLKFSICILCISLSTLSHAQKKKLIVFFEFNDSALQQSEKDNIKTGLHRLQGKYNITQVEIFGHCDSIGNTEYNNKLSLQRAESVKQFLIQEKNISAPISAQGLGKDQPMYSNKQEDERSKNRRVDIILHLQKAIPPSTKKKQDSAKTGLSKALDTTKAGDNIRLKNINFEPGTAILLESAQLPLKELIEIMKSTPSLEIEIQGHICCTPDDEDDNGLSTRRAQAIYNILIKNGIDKNRMVYKGYGHSRPLTAELTTREQMLNRRVEIKILKK